ncbi:hypothetical protein N7492_007000 [Penicillium capsulatum]|uniref:Tyrosine specific protein phosphatases domain-containing protein n=1 Tax=Penicillium capsulatum TaxID=69766 RepID=A0A9W9I185_9EURO|nr:hypothetical protein N7492_007000 [Penicillium capsulatum]KAJ6116833.1 hypothetical protein N7512_006558 [Penicillium capsulatum]
MSRFFSPTEVPMSQGEKVSYAPTHEYNTGCKSIRSPGFPTLSYYDPLDDEDDDNEGNTVVVDNTLFKQASHNLAEGEFVPPGFWSRTQLDGFTRRFKNSQWTYEMRREAQQVLPFLSLGPSSCLRDLEFLRHQGFTLLLAVRNRSSAHARLVSGDKAATSLGIESDTIDVFDNQELISEFPRAIRRINDHLAGMDIDPNAHTVPTGPDGQPLKKKVLVFCESGNERSAGVVIAYAMAMLSVDVAHATRLVQQHRFCVSLEDPMKRILFAFDSILAAKRDVENARHTVPQSGATTLAPPPVPPQMLSKKRSFADRVADDFDPTGDCMDIDGEDMPMERKPQAPFQDLTP